MAYGTFNAGSGVSTYDLDLLAAGVINGCVNAPLTTTDEVAIAARNGKQIVAYTVRLQEKSDDDSAVTPAVAGLVRMIEANRSESLTERRTLAADIIRGIVSAPLMTRDENLICLSGGEPLLAYQVDEDEKSYTDKAIAKAVAELMTTGDWYQARNIAAMEILNAERLSLAADVIRGTISVPIMTRSEEPICIHNGEPLIAYQPKEDEKSYTDKTVKKAVAELFATVEWYLAKIDEDEKSYTDKAVASLSAVVEQYQAQNVATMQTLATERQILAADIMRGTVSAPLLTNSGTQICLTNGEQLFAYQVREDEKSYADMVIMKNFAELSATVERYQAQNLAAMQSLVTSLMSGHFAVPMANNEGTAVITHKGVDIAAIKNL